jgi:hypothetical protein
VVLLSVALPFAPMAPAVAQEDGDGVSIDARSVYRVEPVERRVRVTVDLQLANTLPNQVVGDAIRIQYFPEVSVPVPDEAVSVAATGAGRALAVSVEAVPESIFDSAVVDLSPDLRYGAPQSVRVTYDLLDAPVRSQALTRVTPAFVSVFAAAVGDPGRSDVEIVLPHGYGDVDAPELVEGELPSGERRFTAQDIPDANWFGGLVARNDEQLARRDLEVADREVVIRAWPDDHEWAAFAEREVGRGLPVLTELIGLPRRGDLEVTEAFTPYLYGAGGWYTAGGQIEVGNELDPEALFHELAHDWFNAELFAERWISEGLAQEYAALTLAEVGHPATAPTPVDPADPVRFPLNGWAEVEITDEAADLIERYGYNAAWAVFRGIRDEIGDRDFRRVITGALDDAPTYPGEEATRGDQVAPNWRYLLDLFEDGGSARAADLFRDLVATVPEAVAIDQRRDHRAAYDRLRDAGHGWVPPAGVRRDMRRWAFDDIGDTMEAAGRVLAERDRLAAVAEDADLALPRSLELAYEGASETARLATVRRSAAELVGAGRQVIDADRAVEAADGLWATIGSWGGGADEDLAEAQAAFEDGNAAGTTSAADAAVAAAQGADAAGKRRVGVAIVVVVLVAGGIAAALRVRRRRPSGEGDGSPPSVEDAVVAEPDRA